MWLETEGLRKGNRGLKLVIRGTRNVRPYYNLVRSFPITEQTRSRLLLFADQIAGSCVPYFFFRCCKNSLQLNIISDLGFCPTKKHNWGTLGQLQLKKKLRVFSHMNDANMFVAFKFDSSFVSTIWGFKVWMLGNEGFWMLGNV